MPAASAERNSVECRNMSTPAAHGVVSTKDPDFNQLCFPGLNTGYMAEREGFSARVPRTSKTAVKSAFPDNRGGLCVPPVCTGPASASQADSAVWLRAFHTTAKILSRFLDDCRPLEAAIPCSQACSRICAPIDADRDMIAHHRPNNDGAQELAGGVRFEASAPRLRRDRRSGLRGQPQRGASPTRRRSRTQPR